MASLTTMVSDLSRRVGALENTVNDESDIIPLISKLYTTVTCHPVYCADTLACSTTLACDEDANGKVISLAGMLTNIGIGTGAAPSPGDLILEGEKSRKQIIDPVVVDDTLLLSASWDESEANGYNYTNAGAFWTVRRYTNLLGANGNFAVDSNGDGLADGWTAFRLGSTSMVGNVQTFTANLQYGGILGNIVATNTTDKWYVCGYMQANSNLASIAWTGAYKSYHTGSGNYEFLSFLDVRNNTSNFDVIFSDNRASGWVGIKVKYAHIFNLTELFGAGNEPTKAQMDTLIKNYIDANGYLQDLSESIFFGGSINQTKDSTKSLTVGIEITAVEV